MWCIKYIINLYIYITTNTSNSSYYTKYYKKYTIVGHYQFLFNGFIANAPQ